MSEYSYIVADEYLEQLELFTKEHYEKKKRFT